MSRQQPKSVAIIGAGLAGAACANAFVHKGYSVTVYEQATTSAAGASGVPVAMFAPSVSADDAPHSRLLRQGVHHLLAELERLSQLGLLASGQDWALTGVLERCIRGEKKLPSTWLAPQDAPDLQSRALGKPHSIRPAELWHGMGGWVNPSRLINAWLTHPAITLKNNHPIDDVTKLMSDVVVVATGYQTAKVLPELQNRLQAIRGQVEYGPIEWSAEPVNWPFAHPVNGFGHFVQTPGRWLVGATFQRDESDVAPRAKDVALNFEKLASLMPELATSRRTRLQQEATSWVGIRAAQKNRAPLIERVTCAGHPHVWVCTGLGSRGLSLAALCASRLLFGVEGSLALG